jgi:hypothetical protein
MSPEIGRGHKAEQRLINRLIGPGMLALGDDLVVRCQYHLEVFQDIKVLGAGAEMKGAVTVTGFIDVVLRSAAPETADLTLLDGRQLELTTLKASAWKSVEADKWTLWVSSSPAHYV